MGNEAGPARPWYDRPDDDWERRLVELVVALNDARYNRVTAARKRWPQSPEKLMVMMAVLCQRWVVKRNMDAGLIEKAGAMGGGTLGRLPIGRLFWDALWAD